VTGTTARSNNMSLTNTPTKTGFVGNNYESSTNHYDPDFTAEISTKMRVPDKISVMPGVELRESKIEKSQFNGDSLQPVKDKLNYMHVPDRILVVGGNKHVAGREPYLVENRVNEDLHNFDDDIELKTPPNVLTLNDINSQENGHIKAFNESILYPNEDDLSRNDLLNYNSFYNSSQNVGNQNSSDDTQIIRKQIKHLNRRVNALEIENRNRYHREILFYALGLIYLTAKGLSWFGQRRFY